MAIEIVDFPIKNGGSFHSYVAVYQRLKPPTRWVQWWLHGELSMKNAGFSWDF